MARMTGFFITFEGCEGSGKSTHAKLLFKYLKKTGVKRKILFTFEPGDSTIAKGIRNILLNPRYAIDPVAELFLYESDRAQHLKDIIVPALRAGHIIICDRFTDSTLAYQGFGRNLPLPMIQTLNSIASKNIQPDLTLYLDTPIEQGLEKARQLEKESYVHGDRIERETLSFHRKVRKGFLSLARKEPQRIKVIRVYPDMNETHKMIVNIVRKTLKNKGIFYPHEL